MINFCSLFKAQDIKASSKGKSDYFGHEWKSIVRFSEALWSHHSKRILSALLEVLTGEAVLLMLIVNECILK